MAERVGQQFGNYRLIRLLGQGGFADVYLAKHIHLDTQVAIKVLSMRLTKDDMERFRSEARTIAHFVHPHIVRILDFGVEDDTPYLIMDYAPGGSLRQRHPKGTQLSLITIVDYVKQIVEALQYAHEKKLIHRDIKPENMLLGEHEQVLLSDFGIALVAQSTHYQSIQEVIGTAAYMAPEQLQGKPRRASDQYALGIVTYEWLCGERPFHGSFTELCSQHLLVPPSSLCEKVAELPRAVEEVVLTALAKDPTQRFPSVQAFAMALEQAYRSGPIYPPAPFIVDPALDQSPQPNIVASSTQPAWSTETVAAVPANQVEKSAEGVTSSRQPLESANTVIPAEQSSQLPTTGIPSETLPVSPPSEREASLSGGLRPSLLPQRGRSRRAVMTGLVGLAGISVVGGGIVWWAHSQGTLYTYYGHTLPVHAVTWSPDGKRIASASEDHTVQVWDAADGGNAYTYRGHSDTVGDVAWSPDGKHIASCSVDKTVQVWNAADGGHIYTYQGHTAPLDAITWSPDSTRIASCGWDNVVQVWDAIDGGHEYTYRGHTDTVSDVAWSPAGKRIASASYDRTIQIWDVVDGSHVYTYSGDLGVNNGYLSAVAWSPNSEYIVSASYEQTTVDIWDAAVNGNHVYTCRGHSAGVYAVAWSPNSTRIASGSYDRTVQVWMQGIGAAFIRTMVILLIYLPWHGLPIAHALPLEATITQYRCGRYSQINRRSARVLSR